MVHRFPIILVLFYFASIFQPVFTDPCPNTCTGQGHMVTDPNCRMPCNNRGFCMANLMCQCDWGYTGPDCSTPSCMPACQMGGKCVAPNSCSCPNGFGSVDCSVAATGCTSCCNPPCKNGGTCIDKTTIASQTSGVETNLLASYACICARGFVGYDCSYFVPENPPKKSPPDPSVSFLMLSMVDQLRMELYAYLDRAESKLLDESLPAYVDYATNRELQSMQHKQRTDTHDINRLDDELDYYRRQQKRTMSKRKEN